MIDAYDSIYDKLQDPIKVYLPKETKTMLDEDFKNFEIENKNLFYNLLISNYIEDYLLSFKRAGEAVLNRMKELLGSSIEINNFPNIAKELVLSSLNSSNNNQKESFVSIRINNQNYDKIAALSSSVFDDLKPSIFFRNLFISYLTLPIYKREQVIFKSKYLIICEAIREGKKISYRNKNTQKSLSFNLYSLEQSKFEFHNYLVGCFDDKTGASSIKLINIESIRVLDENPKYNSMFNDCYNIMRLNGFQFPVSKLEKFKVYLSSDDYNTYKKRYLERPEIIEVGNDNKGNYYIFNCSRFQIENYFSPFKNLIQIEDYNYNVIKLR